MHKFFKNSLLSFSASLLLVSFTACGGDTAPTDTTAKDTNTSNDANISNENNSTKDVVKQLPASPAVQEAFDHFNDFNFSNATAQSQQDLVTELKSILDNPEANDTSPDIETAKALIELFELSDDPIISKYFNISLKDYPKLVSSLTDISNGGDVNSLLNGDISSSISSFDLGSLMTKGFSYDLPAPAHKAALKFKNLSDALAKSFPDEDYVFQYWVDDSFNGYLAKYLRVALLTSSALLEFIASYDYGAPEDYGTAENNYTTVLYDPVSVLNSHKVFVYDKDGVDREGNEVGRLENAKDLLIEAMELAQSVNTYKLPESSIDYQKYLDQINAVLQNLKAEDGTQDTYKYDTGLLKPKLYIDFQSLFNPDTALDITDFGNNTFYYYCENSEYNLTTSMSDGKFARCSDGSIALIHLDEEKAKNIKLSDTNFDELVVEIKEIGLTVTKSILLPELFKTINTTTDEQAALIQSLDGK